MNAWKDHKLETSTGHTLLERWPASAPAILARPGMVVQVLDRFERAVIETMTPEFCFVRFEDGSADALRWCEVELMNLQPDPAYLARPPQRGKRGKKGGERHA